MMAKPTKTLELHYLMIQFLIITVITRCHVVLLWFGLRICWFDEYRPSDPLNIIFVKDQEFCNVSLLSVRYDGQSESEQANLIDEPAR